MASGDKTPGRRISRDERHFEPGDYQPREDGKGWNVRPPRGHIGWLSTTPGHHTVIEHPDGTISVTPSIFQHYHQGGSDCTAECWHGYLTDGVWIEV